MTMFNPGVPLGSVLCTKIVDSDSAIIDIAVGVAGAFAGGVAWENMMNTWTEREAKRQEEAKYHLSEIG